MELRINNLILQYLPNIVTMINIAIPIYIPLIL